MQDRLKAIRARCEAGRPILCIDVKYLLSRIEELTREVEQANNYVEIYRDICSRHAEINQKLVAVVKRLREAPDIEEGAAIAGEAIHEKK